MRCCVSIVAKNCHSKNVNAFCRILCHVNTVAWYCCVCAMCVCMQTVHRIGCAHPILPQQQNALRFKQTHLNERTLSVAGLFFSFHFIFYFYFYYSPLFRWLMLEKCLKWNSAWTQINTLLHYKHTHTRKLIFPVARKTNDSRHSDCYCCIFVAVFCFVSASLSIQFAFNYIWKKNDIHYVPSAFRYLPPLPLSFLIEEKKTKRGEK